MWRNDRFSIGRLNYTLSKAERLMVGYIPYTINKKNKKCKSLSTEAFNLYYC